jgi:hypothetical protein
VLICRLLYPDGKKPEKTAFPEKLPLCAILWVRFGAAGVGSGRVQRSQGQFRAPYGGAFSRQLPDRRSDSPVSGAGKAPVLPAKIFVNVKLPVSGGRVVHCFAFQYSSRKQVSRRRF